MKRKKNENRQNEPIKVFSASVLKPIDDVRNYLKIAESLAKSGKFSVYMFGRKPNLPITYNDSIIRFYSFSGGITITKRIWAQFKLLTYLVKVKPQIIICNSPEILIVMCIYKIIFGSKMLYDIQENYLSNVLHTDTYFWPTRFFRVLAIWLSERLANQLINGAILAEHCYKTELKWLKRPYIVLENKFKNYYVEENISNSQIPIYLANNNVFSKNYYLASGTLAKQYGTDLLLNTFAKHPFAKLVLVGYSANKEFSTQIRDIANKSANIMLITKNEPIPHPTIINLTKKAKAVLMPYKLNKSSEHRIPTKLFECGALKIPMVIQKNIYWENYCLPRKCAVFVDFKNTTVEEIDKLVNSFDFYKNAKIDDYLWTDEYNKMLIDFVANI